MSGLMRSLRLLAAVCAILAIAAAGIGAAWYIADRTTTIQRLEAEARTDAAVTGLAASFSDQLNRQILALDQSLDLMVREWEADPRRFDLEAWRVRSKVLNGISRDMFLADENGVIRQSSVADFVGQSAADLDVFRDAAEHANDKPSLFLGPPAVNPIMRQWHLDAARTLHYPDGSFAGIIVADYRVAAITDVFKAGAPAGNSFAALVGLTDGKLRAAFGPQVTAQDSSIADTPMFAAVDAAAAGVWTGPSVSDAVLRLHAFRRLPGRDLTVIVGLDQQEALRPATLWKTLARLFAAIISGLIVIVAILFLSELRALRLRAVKARETAAGLAAANALAEVSRAQADATARRLRATFAAVTEGIAVFDAHLDLVEWNGLFPDHAGVNASLIRIGLPMEDLLQAQAESGCFGYVSNVSAEVERRVSLFRAGNFGDSQSYTADGRAIELRCLPLPEGGFVALYADVTNARQARQALRDARGALEHERHARVRFLGALTHEVRERITVLMRSIGWLRTLGLEPTQTDALDRVHRTGETLASLVADMDEVPLMEAGKMTLRPALLPVGPLLRDIVETIQPAARDRGLTIYLIVYETAPQELIADPHRVRQIISLLLTEALRFATPGAMWLMVDSGPESAGPQTEGETTAADLAMRVTIRGFGTPIPEARRANMFRSFDSVSAPPGYGPSDLTFARTTIPSGPLAPNTPHPATPEDAAGTGLGPAIAKYLSSLMGGELRCETWATADGRTGNDVLLLLPRVLLPGQNGRAPGTAPAEGRPLPRTRVLLVGAHSGIRMAAVTMLERDGHMVDAPRSGAEAIRALDTTPYDIVFIDTVLPDLTLEMVADSIRALPGPPRTVPVIAVAVTHEPYEAAAWRDAGIDEIMTAPPGLRDLTDAIARHVWLTGTAGRGGNAGAGWEDEAEEGIPILSSARILELRANIQTDQLNDMAEECIADLTHRLPALRRSLAAGSPGAITAHAHAMVGMASGYGMTALEARLRAILTAARDQRLDTIDGAADTVEHDLTRASVTLRRALGILTPVEAGEGD